MRKLNKGEIALILSPIENEDGEWDGSLNTTLGFGDEHLVEGMNAALDMACTLASVPDMLDDYPEIEEILIDYKSALLKEVFPEQWERANEELSMEQDAESSGKVVKLDQWSKTMGSA